MPSPVKINELIEQELPRFLIIGFRYTEYVFPYEDGIKILEMFRKAESYNRDDYNNPKILPIDTKSIEVKLMSGEEYRDLKAKELLRVNNDES